MGKLKVANSLLVGRMFVFFEASIKLSWLRLKKLQFSRCAGGSATFWPFAAEVSCLHLTTGRAPSDRVMIERVENGSVKMKL